MALEFKETKHQLTDTKAFYEALSSIVSTTVAKPNFSVYNEGDAPLISNLIKEVGKALIDAEIEARKVRDAFDK
jgi:hypothetical protein